MSLQEVMEAVEGHQFAAELNLASGSSAFYRSLGNHPLFLALAGLLKHGRERELVFRRVIELSNYPIQLEFENPFDAALTTYLTALDAQCPIRAAIAARAASKAPNCWWAAESSERLLTAAQKRQMLGKLESYIGFNASDTAALGTIILPVEPVPFVDSMVGYPAGARLVTTSALRRNRKGKHSRSTRFSATRPTHSHSRETDTKGTLPWPENLSTEHNSNGMKISHLFTPITSGMR